MGIDYGSPTVRTEQTYGSKIGCGNSMLESI
jgi:hypothetical protein